MLTIAFSFVAVLATATAFPDSKHRFIEGGEGFERSPCPAINTLANHGFIKRNGRDIRILDLIDALESNFPVIPGFALSPANTARRLGLLKQFGNRFTDEEIAGANNTAAEEMLPFLGLDIINLFVPEFEHDASFTRVDGNLPSSISPPNAERLQALLEMNPGYDYITKEDLMEFQRQNIMESCADGTTDVKDTRGTLAAQATLIMTWGQTEDLTILSKSTIQGFLLEETCKHTTARIGTIVVIYIRPSDVNVIFLFHTVPNDFDPANHGAIAFEGVAANVRVEFQQSVDAAITEYCP